MSRPRPSKQGKLPRHIAAAERESIDPAYRSRMEIARQQLHAELIADAQPASWMASEVRRLQDQVREWEKLGDPATLHANLLRGIPCQLDRAAFLHLAGDETVAQEAQRG